MTLPAASFEGWVSSESLCQLTSLHRLTVFWSEGHQNDVLSNLQALSLHLLTERAKGPDSFWAPFLVRLPDQVRLCSGTLCSRSRRHRSVLCRTRNIESDVISLQGVSLEVHAFSAEHYISISISICTPKTISSSLSGVTACVLCRQTTRCCGTRSSAHGCRARPWLARSPTVGIKSLR